MQNILLETKNICKSFGHTQALDSVDLQIVGGEICGLIGENGSGKSTLSSIIAGFQKQDQGEMCKNGIPYSPADSIASQRLGVAMIVQEAGTIPNISVADNIFAGKENHFLRGPFVSHRKMQGEAMKVLHEIGVTKINPAASINVLNQEERKLVEIARALYENPDILIVDETTSALSKDGRVILYNVIREMRAQGKGILFISHDIAEIIDVCDSLVVLRDGTFIGKLEKADMDPERIKNMMIGRQASGHYYREDNDGFDHQVVMEAINLTGKQNSVKDVNFKLHKGEILGIAGLSESGMHEVGRMAFGMDAAVKGKIVLGNGQHLTNSVQAVVNGIGYVSKNRDVEALSLSASVKDNISLPSLRKIRRLGLISKKKEKDIVQEQVSQLKIKCSSIDQPVHFLSGGNKQKVVFGKWLANNAEILILDCPTRGVDIGVKAAMYQLMYEMKKAGRSILMISEELTELIGMADRILVMKNGVIQDEFLRDGEMTEQNLIKYMI